jgi:LacI family transcriptional regulator
MQQDGVDTAKKILAMPNKIDGIFSANDVATIGAMLYLKKERVSIPNDIAIVGFSNESISSVVEPSLTTINQSGFKIGTVATDLLLTQINNKSVTLKPETIILEPSLVERYSSKRL